MTMHRVLCVAVALLLPSVSGAGEKASQPVASGLEKPEAVAVDASGKVYVTVAGVQGEKGGAVMLLEKGKVVPIATGLDQPEGLAAHAKKIYVADRTRIWRIDDQGKKEVFVPAAAFPTPPRALTALTVDPESSILYVADAGESRGEGAAVYRVNPTGGVSVVTNGKRWPGLSPGRLAMDGASFLLVTNSITGTLHRIRLADGTAQLVAEGLGDGRGLAWDRFGRLFIGDQGGGKAFGIARPGQKPVALAARFNEPGGFCLDSTGRYLLVPDRMAGTVTEVPTSIPGAEVDDTPLPLQVVPAFPNLRWQGYAPESATGKSVELRPVLLTHAGDGSNRVFVGIQQGIVHVFPNDPAVKQTRIFLDLHERVAYSDKTNEEGFLGLAFHPRYRENGEFFVFYTLRTPRLTNVVSRFRVSHDDPNRADPSSEQELLRFSRPFWNHDGGTLCFGPDGYLYVAVGDGGDAGDPFNNGQNLKSPLAKILRIDVDRKDPGKNYAVPPDNPFVNRPDARPETWAYGLRNVWRMAFDRKTGTLWAADVGQNLYEEINLIVKGGNYGWKLREGLHPFGKDGSGPRPDLIDPIWEYHHDIGRSVTGGLVYRGTRLPELAGAYLYGDYVTGNIWALRYSDDQKRVVSNRPIPDRKLLLPSFGEDEQGEAYVLTFLPSHQVIYRFDRAAPLRKTR
jgi:glucose/arabinose dehydrogenase